MNTSPSKSARIAATALIAIAGVFALSALVAQTSSPSVSAKTTAKPSPSPWPTKPPFAVAIKALTSTLTRAASDGEFRKQLLRSSDSAKTCIENQGNVTIPPDRVFVFFEGQDLPTKSWLPPVAGTPNKDRGTFRTDDGGKTWVNLFGASRSSENIHVFVLPPFDPNNTTTVYTYQEYFKCCYDYWTE